MTIIPDSIDFLNDVNIVKLRLGITTDSTFECKTREFTEYYQMHSVIDMEYGISKTWQMTHDGKVVGYISLATSHMEKDESEYFNAKELGKNIPAVLVSHLATRKGWEKKGIGETLLKWAINKAVIISNTVACRVIMLNPYASEDVRNFYINRGFTYVEHDDKSKDICYLDLQTGEHQSGVN